MATAIENPTMTTASAVVIEELTPSEKGKQPRKLFLVGAGLPLKGADWGSENNLITEWYPGNGIEATQQNMGFREMPTSWTGEWRRTMLGRSPCTYVDGDGGVHQIVSPMVLRSVVEDIQRGGARLRVTWTSQGQRLVGSRFGGVDRLDSTAIVREGQMKPFKCTVESATDMTWSLEWNWSGRGARTSKVVAVDRDEDIGKVSSSFSATSEALTAAVQFRKALNRQRRAAGFAELEEVRKGANNFSLGRLEALAKAPAKLVDSVGRKVQQKALQLSRVAAVAAKFRSIPSAVVSSALDVAQNTLAIANVAKDDISSLGSESFVEKDKLTRAGAMIRSYKYFMEFHDAAEAVARRSNEVDARVRALLVSGASNGKVTVKASSTTRAGDILAVHVCRQGETPTSISSKFYRSPDHGDEILRANRLPWHTAILRPGQILVIPTLGRRSAPG